MQGGFLFRDVSGVSEEMSCGLSFDEVAVKFDVA